MTVHAVCDGGAAGVGHASRCVAVAERFRDRGLSPSFVVLGGGPALAFVGAEGFRARAGAEGAWPSLAGTHVLVDSYRLGEPPAGLLDGRRVGWFSDERVPPGRYDVVVDPNFGAERRADELDGLKLLGHRYAPLRRRILDLRAARAGVADRVGRVLAYMGAAPPGAWTLVLRALADALPGARVAALVLPGQEAEAGGAPGPERVLLPAPHDLPGALADADLAVTSAGVVKYELAAIGVPAVLLGVQANQLPVAAAFAETGAAAFAGPVAALDPSSLAGRIRAIAYDASARHAMSEAGRKLIDGRGADRIADVLLG